MKKGFTLIELLATIVVLAIIALITVPVISNVINKARLNALKDSAYGLIEASELYYAQYGSNNVRFDIEESNITSNDTDKLLSYKGSIKTGVVIINTKGKSTICITDGKNSAYKNYNENKVTLVSSKRCTVPSNTNIVYLDNEATLTELSNQELTNEIEQIKLRLSTVENKNILDSTYPIGSVYISFNSTNPSTLFGGTWEKVKDTFLLANGDTFSSNTAGGSTSTSYTPAGTVGNTTLTINQIPAHTHTRGTMNITGTAYNFGHTSNVTHGINLKDSGMSGAFYSFSHNYSYAMYPWSDHVLTADQGHSGFGFDASRGWTGETSSVGGSQAHTHTFTGTSSSINTMPPYTTVYMWKRTA